VAALYEDALVYETGSAMTSSGALTAYSGAKTGRSPLDKRVVKEPGSEKDIWWGPVNKPMSPEVSPREALLHMFLHNFIPTLTRAFGHRVAK
jgi:ATP-dependent phosphoenolpyruvate carboxykinase